MRSRARSASQPSQHNDSDAGPSQTHFATQQPTQQHHTQQQTQQTPAGVPDHVRFTFLQHIMTRGYIKESDAKACIRNLVGQSDDSRFDQVVREINGGTGVTAAGLELRRIKHLVDDQRYIGLINKHNDAPAKLATVYTPVQMNFFKHVLEAISTKDDDAHKAGMPCASEMELLNLNIMGHAGGAGSSSQAAAAPVKDLSKEARGDMLRQLLNEGWLSSVPNKIGWYTLGVRTFLELGREYLMTGVEGVPEATRAAWDRIL